MIEPPIPHEYLYFRPSMLGGQETYEKICAFIGLRSVEAGYGVLLLASEVSEAHATFVTWDVPWVEAIADVAQQVLRGDITPEAGGMDLSPEVLRDKAAALLVGWPDEWGNRPPQGHSVPEYRA